MPGLPSRDHGFDKLPLLVGEIPRIRLAHAQAITQANPERLTGGVAPTSHQRAITSRTEVTYRTLGLVRIDSATQFPALDAEGQAMVHAMINSLRAMLEKALLAAGAGEQEAAELALCTLATNKSLAVLSRAGFSSNDLATVAAAAARIPGETTFTT
jgi:hypothetical protein